MLKQNKVFATINRIIDTQGRKVAFLMRLSPLCPMEVCNVVAPLTSMTLRDNAIASVGSFMPTTYHVWLSATATAVAKGQIAQSASSVYITVIVNILILALMCLQMVRIKKQYLAQT